MGRFDELSREELIKRAQLTSEMALVVDGLWFLAAEKATGFESALDMDIDVWKRYVHVSAKRIRKYFDLELTGLEGIKEFMKYDPMWDAIAFELIDDSPHQLIFQVRSCQSLEAMEKMGRELLTCEAVEGAYLEELARIVDPRIRVQPLKLPPRASPDEICCQWVFTLEDITA